MSIIYSVKFAPGKYKYVPGTSSAGRAYWIVGREDTGAEIGFMFSEDEAKHVCLALNLVDAYIGGDTASQRDILTALERFRH